MQAFKALHRTKQIDSLLLEKLNQEALKRKKYLSGRDLVKIIATNFDTKFEKRNHYSGQLINHIINTNIVNNLNNDYLTTFLKCVYFDKLGADSDQNRIEESKMIIDMLLKKIVDRLSIFFGMNGQIKDGIDRNDIDRTTLKGEISDEFINVLILIGRFDSNIVELIINYYDKSPYLNWKKLVNILYFFIKYEQYQDPKKLNAHYETKKVEIFQKMLVSVGDSLSKVIFQQKLIH